MKVVGSQWSVVSKSPWRRAARLIVIICLLPTAFLPAGSQAQQPKKIPRIGYLSSSDHATESPRAEGIRLALSKLGYVDGQNIAIEYRYADTNRDRQVEHAADLVRLKVDVIIVGGGPGPVRAVKNATKTIPIIMTGIGADPVKAGLIESLARPGGNVTGLTNISIELGGKRLELFKEAVPTLVRVAVFYDPAYRESEIDVKEVLPVAARALGLSLQSWEIRAAEDFDKVFSALNKQPPDGLYNSAGTLLTTNRNRTVGFALKSRLPSVHGNREAVEVGGLMSYGTNPTDRYRRVAYFVDKILKGAKAADLPVEQPTKFELVINLKTADKIGLNIPQRMLSRADKVIK